MKRICVLGDSHLACIKLGWESLKAGADDVNPTFFADIGLGLQGLALCGDCLVPQSEQLRRTLEHTSGGRGTVDLSSYDAVVLIGLRLVPYPKHEWGHFSTAVRRRYLVERTPGTLCHELASKIRAASSMPMFLAHQPLMACPEEIEIEGDLEPFLDCVRTLNDDIFASLRARVLPQPIPTITNGMFTKRRYCKDNPRLDVGRGDANLARRKEERGHMNVDFGRLWLETHLPEVVGTHRS